MLRNRILPKLSCSVVYVWVLVLEVVGGVLVNDETDRVWSEALFALTCCSSKQKLFKVTVYTIMYQGTKVPPHRYLDYTSIDIYTIHIASLQLGVAPRILSPNSHWDRCSLSDPDVLSREDPLYLSKNWNWNPAPSSGEQRKSSPTNHRRGSSCKPPPSHDEAASVQMSSIAKFISKRMMTFF